MNRDIEISVIIRRARQKNKRAKDRPKNTKVLCKEPKD